jgi:hypothetical protein
MASSTDVHHFLAQEMSIRQIAVVAFLKQPEIFDQMWYFHP